MRHVLSAIFLLFVATANSQNVIDVDKNNVRVTPALYYTVGGTPVSNTKYVRLVEGSPYFTDGWMKAVLMIQDGRVYDSVLVRLDLVENKLQYLGPDGAEMTATTPVSQVVLLDSVLGDKYHFVYSSFLKGPVVKEEGWYQLLTDGKTALYKRIIKTLTENKPYSSATTEQTIKTTSQYFILNNSDFTRIKKIKDIPELLADKKNELTGYVNSKNLSGKSDSDFAALISYYNNISGK